MMVIPINHNAKKCLTVPDQKEIFPWQKNIFICKQTDELLLSDSENHTTQDIAFLN